MRRLADTSLDWALEHLRRYSDTDKFPHPFEVDVIGRLWTSSFRAQLGTIDLAQHRWTGERKMLVPKDGASFRNAAQLDPIDAVLLAGLIYEVGAQIEQKRSPIADKRVFSYRFAPNSDGTLFGPDQWDAFWETSILRSTRWPVVLMLDISDFYNQISHHSIENQLQRCDLGAPDIKILMNLLTVVVNKDVAFPMRRRLELSDSSEPIYWDSKRPPLADSSFCNGLTIVPAWQPSPLHRPQLAC